MKLELSVPQQSDQRIKLRVATADDAPAIAALHTLSWQRAYRGILSDRYLDHEAAADRARLWARRLDAPAQNQHTIVALDDNSMIGFACAYGDEEKPWGTMLDNLHVHADWRGHGVGRQLMIAAATWSREQYPTLGFYLWVFEQNAPARRFYETLGATNSESVTADVPGGGRAVECRYTWARPDALIAQASMTDA